MSKKLNVSIKPSPLPSPLHKTKLLTTSERVVVIAGCVLCAYYREGDTGTITCSWPPVREIKNDGDDMTLYEVKLTKPRDRSYALVLLRGFEITAAPSLPTVQPPRRGSQTARK